MRTEIILAVTFKMVSGLWHDGLSFFKSLTNDSDPK